MNRTITKRIVSIVLLLGFLLNLPIMAFAVGDGTMTIIAASASGRPGETVDVDIMLENNPGLCSLKFDVLYNNILTIESISLNNADFGTYLTAPEPYANPQTISLISPLNEISKNGKLATITFRIDEEATDGSFADVKL